MKPICVPCQRFYRPKKNGFAFIEGMPLPGGVAVPGTATPERWKPYKLWEGDLWECPDCKAQVIVGAGSKPISEHYETDFAKKVEAFGGSQLQVNDC